MRHRLARHSHRLYLRPDFARVSLSQDEGDGGENRHGGAHGRLAPLGPDPSLQGPWVSCRERWAWFTAVRPSPFEKAPVVSKGSVLCCNSLDYSCLPSWL